MQYPVPNQLKPAPPLQDARLFEAIVGDLFPGVNVPHQDYGALAVAVAAAAQDLGLQPVPPFITKVCAIAVDY